MEKSMTSGSIYRLIIVFALPILLSNLFQQLYNSADSLIVGHFLGNDALAAVSSSGNLIAMLVGLFNGIAMGAGVVIARNFGAKRYEELKRAIHTNIALGLIMGIILTILGALLTPLILELMGTPESVMDESIAYLRIYFYGSIGLVMYNIFTGILQSLGDSKHPLYYLIVSSLTNIVLDYVLIAYFDAGVAGAAFATIFSQFLSAFLCMVLLHRSKDSYRLIYRDIKIDKEMTKAILINGIPSGIQNSIIGIANVVVQSNINAFGNLAMAGCGAYSKIEGFAFLPVTSFNLALTTFVGQNMGADLKERAKKGAIFGIVLSMILAEAIGLLTVIFAPELIALFANDPEVIGFGVDRATIAGIFFFLCAFTHAYSSVLRGLGKAVIPMLNMAISWCVIRVAFLVITGFLFNDIAFVYWCYPITWAISSAYYIYYIIRHKGVIA